VNFISKPSITQFTVELIAQCADFKDKSLFKQPFLALKKWHFLFASIPDCFQLKALI